MYRYEKKDGMTEYNKYESSEEADEEFIFYKEAVAAPKKILKEFQQEVNTSLDTKRPIFETSGWQYIYNKKLKKIGLKIYVDRVEWTVKNKRNFIMFNEMNCIEPGHESPTQDFYRMKHDPKRKEILDICFSIGHNDTDWFNIRLCEEVRTRNNVYPANKETTDNVVKKLGLLMELQVKLLDYQHDIYFGKTVPYHDAILGPTIQPEFDISDLRAVKRKLVEELELW